MNRTLIIGILFFIGIAVGIFLTWPKYQSFEQFNIKLKEHESVLKDRETYYMDLANIKAELVSLVEPLSRIEAALPKDPDLPALYDFLQTASAFSGMSVRNISAAAEKETPSIQLRTIPVTLQLTGSWGAIKEILSRLETASRLTILQSLTISEGTDSGRFNLSVQLNAYSY